MAKINKDEVNKCKNRIVVLVFHGGEDLWQAAS